MSDNETNPTNITLYRELGHLEGRVTALENSTREIKELLNTVMQQLVGIQNTVTSIISRKDGTDSVWHNVKDLLQGMAIPAITTILILMYSK